MNVCTTSWKGIKPQLELPLLLTLHDFTTLLHNQRTFLSSQPLLTRCRRVTHQCWATTRGSFYPPLMAPLASAQRVTAKVAVLLCVFLVFLYVRHTSRDETHDDSVELSPVLQSRALRAWNQTDGPFRALSTDDDAAVEVLRGEVLTFMEDHFEENTHYTFTVVQTPDGQFVRVTGGLPPMHTRNWQNGDAIAWTVAVTTPTPAPNVAAAGVGYAATLGGTAPGGQMTFPTHWRQVRTRCAGFTKPLLPFAEWPCADACVACGLAASGRGMPCRLCRSLGLVT